MKEYEVVSREVEGVWTELLEEKEYDKILYERGKQKFKVKTEN